MNQRVCYHIPPKTEKIVRSKPLRKISNEGVEIKQSYDPYLLQNLQTLQDELEKSEQRISELQNIIQNIEMEKDQTITREQMKSIQEQMSCVEDRKRLQDEVFDLHETLEDKNNLINDQEKKISQLIMENEILNQRIQEFKDDSKRFKDRLSAYPLNQKKKIKKQPSKKESKPNVKKPFRL